MRWPCCFYKLKHQIRCYTNNNSLLVLSCYCCSLKLINDTGENCHNNHLKPIHAMSISLPTSHPPPILPTNAKPPLSALSIGSISGRSNTSPLLSSANTSFASDKQAFRNITRALISTSTSTPEPSPSLDATFDLLEPQKFSPPSDDTVTTMSDP